MRGVIAVVLVLVVSWPASWAQTPLEDLSNYLSTDVGLDFESYTQGIKNIMGGVVGADNKHNSCLQKIFCKVSKLCP